MPSSSSTTSNLPSTEELASDVVKTTKASASALQLRSLAAGGVGGICAVVVGHPFDLVKVRLQTADKGTYSSAVDVVRKSVARAGLARVGFDVAIRDARAKSRQTENTNQPPRANPMFLKVGTLRWCLRTPIMVSFWGYDVGKTLVTRFSSQPSSQPFSIPQLASAGFFSAIPMTLITAPFERVKVLLQIQGQQNLPPGAKPRYSGGLDVVRQLYREGGIRSVFRGSLMTLARDGPGSAAYFASYEYVKRKLTPLDKDGKPSGDLSLTAVMTAGGAAGVAMWIPVFPIDTIKSRLQSAEGRPTIGGVVRGVYASGGFKAFFPGIGPALARAVPANAATFLGVELAHKAMDRMF
ncbi:carnitine transporter [Varicellaria rhodocarpa]|nr:carnitine transporter [Varicellaria rhodocarpa]